MKILVSAFACDPCQGSECFVGWQAVSAIARDHEVWVIAGSRNREGIMIAQEKGIVPPNVHFVFHGNHWKWHMNRMVARLQSWLEYVLWSRTLLPVARDLHKQHHFDLAHHVTYISWRVGSSLWKLGIPFVWGPVGGVASFPQEMMSYLSPKTRKFEALRNWLNKVGRLEPGVRQCVRNASVVVASNRETLEFLSPLRTGKPIVQVWPTVFLQNKIDRLQAAGKDKSVDGPLRIFAGGNLIGTKGVGLAIEGLAMAKAAGVDFQYRLGGGGPEWEHLRELAQRLNLGDSVVFGNSLSGDEYFQALGSSHIFLLPSFRESAPVTISEAMLAGCVPVVANASAQAEIVTDDCGFRAAITTPEGMAREICERIVLLNKDRDLLQRLGEAARQRAATLFTGEKYRESIHEVYKTALAAGAHGK